MKTIQCWECGKDATKMFRQDGTISDQAPYEFRRCYCDECIKKVEIRARVEKETHIRLKKYQMFEAAVKALEKQEQNLYEYKTAIDKTRKYLEKHIDAFDSSYEMLAAMVLLKYHYKVLPQYKIGRYQVDFYIPDEKIVLEIDGTQHKSKRESDSKRDEYIYLILGKDWRIIRIATELLDKNADRLVKAIKTLREGE